MRTLLHWLRVAAEYRNIFSGTDDPRCIELVRIDRDFFERQ